MTSDWGYMLWIAMASTKCHVVDHVIDGHLPRAISYRFLLSDGPHRVSVTYDLLNALLAYT